MTDHPQSSNPSVLKRCIRRAQLAPNAQAGCERSNSKYARFKNKYSSKMGLEIVRSRSRAGENGPPLSLFPSAKAVRYWIDNNHRLAEKVNASDESLVLSRRKKNDAAYCTSKIFFLVQHCSFLWKFNTKLIE